jgi:probable rRNA maturation factor
MDIDILTEDEMWSGLAERETIARKAVEAVFEVLGRPAPDVELSIVFAGDDEVAQLNRSFRGKPGPTNVLSFPAAASSAEAGPRVLGDIVLAGGVVSREAEQQGKPLASHATHLIVHGVLHLLGHDHDREDQALAMERLEAEVMARLGFPDPYQDAEARESLGPSRAAG